MTSYISAALQAMASDPNGNFFLMSSRFTVGIQASRAFIFKQNSFFFLLHLHDFEPA